MYKYFSRFATKSEVKARYRELCKQYHPDLHDAADFEYYNNIMSEINAEYDMAYARAKSDSAADNTTDSTSNTNAQAPEEFREIINKVIAFDGVDIDIVGEWVWLVGNTYAYRTEIKAAGFKWASKKQAWYWHAGEWHGRHSRKTLDELKDKYGCQSVKGAARPQLA